MTYEIDHAGAFEAVSEAGASVTFTLTRPGTPVPLTGRYSDPSVTTVSGYAIRVKGEGEDQYAGYGGGEMTQRNPLTLFFVPSTFGQVPPADSVVMWADDSHKVKKTRDVAPDGTAIASYVVLE